MITNVLPPFYGSQCIILFQFSHVLAIHLAVRCIGQRQCINLEISVSVGRT